MALEPQTHFSICFGYFQHLGSFFPICQEPPHGTRTPNPFPPSVLGTLRLMGAVFGLPEQPAPQPRPFISQLMLRIGLWEASVTQPQVPINIGAGWADRKQDCSL